MTAAEVLEGQHELASFWERGLIEPVTSNSSKESHAQTLRIASTFLVRPNMCDVIDAAREQLEDDAFLGVHDWPCEHGFLAYDKPPPLLVITEDLLRDANLEEQTLPIGSRTYLCAIEWTTAKQIRQHHGAASLGGGVLLTGYRSSDATGTKMDVLCEKILPHFGAPHWKAPEFEKPIVSAVVSTMLIIKQRIAIISRERAERSARRRLARADSPLSESEVRVVDLRLPEYLRNAEAGASSVDWKRRWMVSGHWRQQWYAKEEVHRTKWIMPYVKGPEDKPLAIRPTVNVLRR